MAGYDRSKNADYTLAVQSALKTLGADLGGPGVDGKWGKYTEAAYRKNRAAVDRLVSEMGVSAAGAYGSGSRLAAEQIDVPEQKGFDEWLSIGGALFAAQAEARKASAKRQLEVNRQQLEQARAQSAVTLENAANARGFGRSSYTADLLQRNENAARDNQTALMNNFSDALMQIDADQAALFYLPQSVHRHGGEGESDAAAGEDRKRSECARCASGTDLSGRNGEAAGGARAPGHPGIHGGGAAAAPARGRG